MERHEGSGPPRSEPADERPNDSRPIEMPAEAKDVKVETESAPPANEPTKETDVPAEGAASHPAEGLPSKEDEPETFSTPIEEHAAITDEVSPVSPIPSPVFETDTPQDVVADTQAARPDQDALAEQSKSGDDQAEPVDTENASICSVQPENAELEPTNDTPEIEEQHEPESQASDQMIDEAASVKAPFNQLPDEIMEQILRLSDPDGFASLALVNRVWRDVSQQAPLYVHHLAHCPTYATSGVKVDPIEDNLPKLRRMFAQEAKRNLFQAYLRPKETIVKLVSTSISPSSCPGGEGMQFSSSPCGHHVLAYNSSRIYVVDVRGENFELKRELKILRRPVSVCIKDDGTLLAVLSSEMQVNLYDLESSPPRRKHSILLDNAPRTIALSPCGSVLAAAYEGGIEVSSLNPGALATDRRAVKCDGVDTLSFSFDGTQILGTTVQSFQANTVILTAPYYDPESQALTNNVSAMWTTSILFPNTSRDCSHAVLLQDGNEEEASWTFTYDRSFETFRAVRIDDLRNGTTYFTGPTQNPSSQAKLLPCTLPSANYRAEVVSAGFQGKDVWVYGIPSSLDAVPDQPSIDGDSSSNPSRTPSSVARNNSSRGREEGDRVPQWQLLCDQHRNTFVAGSKVAESPGVSTVKWVTGFGASALQERLVIGARGVTGPRLVTEEEDVDFVDGGRITLLDFDYATSNGSKTEITIEVGSDDAEVLEEEQRDMETEVAIVRRRTVAQKRGSRVALLRSATTSAAMAAPDVPPLPMPRAEQPADDDPLVPRRIGQRPGNRNTVADPVDSDTASIEEQEALDLPYSHASPRSGTTLRRAATAAAVNRRLNPTTADGRRIEYRRADGRREHPHESDADNWVPPPPPYQKDDPGDLPAFLRGVAPIAPIPAIPTIPPMPHHQMQRPMTSSSHWRPSSIDSMRRPDFSQWRPSHHRTASDSTTMSRRRNPSDTPRPMSSPSVHVDMDDLYDVSPPESPRPVAQPQRSVTPPAEETSEPVPAPVIPAAAPAPQTPAAPVASPVVSSPSEVSRAAGHEAPQPVPSLGLQIPNPQPQPPGQSTPIGNRRLSNSQTWPLAPQSHPPVQHHPVAYPYSAPVSQPPQLPRGAPGLPPPPTSAQLANLNKRISQGNPKRLSGGFQIARVPVGSRDGSRPYSQFNPSQVSGFSTPEMDPPLIVSTPSGVQGAFDPPRHQPRAETPILAPIPRHPHTGANSPHGAAERLETIYNTPEPRRPGTSSSRFIPQWLNRPSKTGPVPPVPPIPGNGFASSTMPSSINRRPSRAERSAAKNVQGWKTMARAKSVRRGKSTRRKRRDEASSAGWTDVSRSSEMAHNGQGGGKKKEKKCAVM